MLSLSSPSFFESHQCAMMVVVLVHGSLAHLNHNNTMLHLLFCHIITYRNASLWRWWRRRRRRCTGNIDTSATSSSLSSSPPNTIPISSSHPLIHHHNLPELIMHAQTDLIFLNINKKKMHRCCITCVQSIWMCHPTYYTFLFLLLPATKKNK